MLQRTLEEKIAELREQLVRHEQRQIKQQQQQVTSAYSEADPALCASGGSVRKHWAFRILSRTRTKSG
jgi:hypothetical protein